MTVAGYTPPDSESITEDQAGAKLLELATAFRASKGKTEDGETDGAVDESATNDEPEEEIETETRETGSDDEIETPDETTDDESELEPDSTPRKRGRTLKVGDREQFVDEDEAYNGYLRQADYTRKTQAHAEVVKATATERAAAVQKREQYDAGLKQIEDALVVMMPQEPDWDRVRAERPNEYGALYTDWRRYQDRLGLVQAERGRVEQERQAETNAQAASRRKDAGERLMTLIPEWRDVSKRDADRVLLTNVARDYGFTDDEIVSMEDPKLVVILRDAARYKQLIAKQKKAKEQINRSTGPSRTAKPGVPGAVTRPSTQYNSAKSKLAKSGNSDDAADAIFQLMKRAKKPKTR